MNAMNIANKTHEFNCVFDSITKLWTVTRVHTRLGIRSVVALLSHRQWLDSITVAESGDTFVPAPDGWIRVGDQRRPAAFHEFCITWCTEIASLDDLSGDIVVPRRRYTDAEVAGFRAEILAFYASGGTVAAWARANGDRISRSKAYQIFHDAVRQSSGSLDGVTTNGEHHSLVQPTMH